MSIKSFEIRGLVELEVEVLGLNHGPFSDALAILLRFTEVYQSSPEGRLMILNSCA